MNDIVRHKCYCAMLSVYIETSTYQKISLEERILSIVEYGSKNYLWLPNEINSLTIQQIEFLVKATGDWDSDTFDVQRCVLDLLERGKLKEDGGKVSWNKVVSHETEHID